MKPRSSARPPFPQATAARGALLLAAIAGVAACESPARAPSARTFDAASLGPLDDSGAGGTVPEPVLPDRPLTLEDCVRLAVGNHAAGRIAEEDVAAAEARAREARSAMWPSLELAARAVRLDGDPYFVAPAQEITLGAAGGRIADAVALSELVKLGLPITPGDPAFDAAFAAARQKARAGLRSLDIPAIEQTILDRDSASASLRATWVIYAGGRIDAAQDRARAGIDAAVETRRETALGAGARAARLHDDVLLADAIAQLADDTGARLGAVQDITKRVYESGSGSATRADYLRTNVIVKTVEGFALGARRAAEQARIGLAEAMGLPPETVIRLVAKLEPRTVPVDPDALADEALRQRPDWARLAAAERALDGELRGAKAEHLPVVALFAEGSRMSSDYDAGAVPSSERQWAVGVEVRLALFSGFATEARIGRIRAESRRLAHAREGMRNGIRAQVHVYISQYRAALEQRGNASEAVGAAEENRSLQFRGYTNDLVETQDVVEAHILEAVTRARLLAATHAQNAAATELLHAVGRMAGAADLR